jgi:uncharacterized protein (DUF2236 family)
MHHRVHGVRPDGVPYDTREPEFFRWNYATVVWGFGRAHELYHPDPLTGADLDEYYLQYCKVGMELYAEDLRGAILPRSKKELDDYLLATSNKMSLSPPGAAVMELYRPEGKPVYLRPLMGLVHWAILDMLPDWARHMMSVPTRSGRVETAARRKAVSGLMKGIDLAAGGWPEIEQAHARATATPRPATAQQKVSALA